MCGIVAILNVKEQTHELREKALKMSQKIRHRGPDWSGVYCGGSAILAHERLSIVDPESGGQPLYSPDRKQVLAVNGEIYNHQDIRRRYAGQYEFQTGSDCEVILALYREWRQQSPSLGEGLGVGSQPSIVAACFASIQHGCYCRVFIMYRCMLRVSSPFGRPLAMCS